MDDFIEMLFKHYRREGFPYFPTNQGYRETRFRELMETNIDDVLENNIIRRTSNAGTSLAWSYFPHAFNVRCKGTITPLEAFNDDKILKSAIRKTCTLSDGFSESNLRSIIRMHSGVQTVSNFRPVAAAALYDYFAPRGVIWDMSGGWGGRLLGAIRSGTKHYIATEPSTETAKGLNLLGEQFGDRYTFNKKKYFDYDIVVKGSEVFKPAKNSLDFCFTSPPYFDLEQYSDEKTQSYVKYGTKELWANEFLLKTFENCYYGLKKGKYMAINIADPKKSRGISLEQETIKQAIKAGFTHTNTLSLMLKAPLGSGKQFKSEPVFLFKK